MMRIILKCADQYINIIKRHMNTYFKELEYINDDNYSKDAIVFKEIQIMKDVQEVENIYKENVEFVFLIGTSEYMFELLEYNPIAFIRLPRIEEDIENIIRLLQYKNKGIGVILDFKSGYQNIRIDSENIEYIESYGHYLLIHTESATFKVREKISDILEKLEPLGFIRVHKSYIINKVYINAKSSNEINMISGVSIPIGNKYKLKINDNKNCCKNHIIAYNESERNYR